MSSIRQVKAIIETGPDHHYSIFIGDGDYPYGIIGTGESIAKAKEDFFRGYEEMRECVLDSGESFQDAEFSFRYDIPSFLQEFAYAFTLSGLERITGINQKQLGHYVSGYRKPSAKTVRRMEEGIHSFCDQLRAVRFT